MTTSHRTRARIVRALTILTPTFSLAACGIAVSHTSPLPTTTHTPAAHVAQAHQQYQEDATQWNCQLDGDHKCSHVPACWTEHKSELPDERLCGYANTAAPSSDGWVFGDYMNNPKVR